MRWYVLLVMALSFSNPSPARAAEDWDFTPDDYVALRGAGGDLRFGPDSDWLPKPFQDNIRATLDWALDPTTGSRATEGINLRDFYHGHVQCVRGSLRRPITFSATREQERIFGALGLKWYDLNDGNYPTYLNGIVEMERTTGAYLREILADPLCDLVIVYHTFELHSPADQPRLDPNDPRRHLVTYQSDLRPQHFEPVACQSRDVLACRPERFQDVLQIGFLVDESGVIHATYGSHDGLSRVMGKVAHIY